MQAVVTGVVLPFPPPVYHLHFSWRIYMVQYPLIVDSSSHRVLLTHALALSSSQIVHQTKDCTSAHEAGFELTELTYIRLEEIS